jgi:energy-coupling factor transporter ATP-binding protein EcfA2
VLDGSSSVEVKALPGEITTIVGANGSGKSALGFWLDAHSDHLGKRLIAHRRLWLQHAGPDISPVQREQTGKNLESWNSSEDSRFIDHADSTRAGMVLFDLLAKLNAESAQMVSRYQSGASPEEVLSEFGLPILERLNGILRMSGLPVELALTDVQTFDAVNRKSQATYPINRMSDGEKSAVLLAAEVITTPEGRIVLIDEPERHLHRSISAGLVDGIINERPDCHFVVLTHDLDLAATLSQRPGRTMSVAACEWKEGAPYGWDLMDVDPDENLPESARIAILGGRRDLLFIEGDDHSLDKRLYEILFPERTLFATGGADQVIRAVTGLSNSAAHHWVKARGVVDGDGRSEEERASLLDRGILALPVSEVENLYYFDAVLGAVATARAELVGGSAADLHRSARDVALKILCDTATLDRLASKLAVAALRRTFVTKIPTKVDEKADPIEISVPSPYPAIRAELASLAYARDYDGLISLLPVRDTALPSRVATSLGFQHSDDYESAVRTRARKDPALVQRIHDLIGPLPER